MKHIIINYYAVKNRYLPFRLLTNWIGVFKTNGETIEFLIRGPVVIPRIILKLIKNHHVFCVSALKIL